MGEKRTFAYDQHSDCLVQTSPAQLVQPFQIDSYLPVGTHTSLVSLPTEVLIMSYLRLLHIASIHCVLTRNKRRLAIPYFFLLPHSKGAHNVL